MLYSLPGMTVASFWRSRSSRTALIVLLLLISFGTALLLALHANYSDASQRATAESVLRDYSALVADEVVRRSAAEIGYYGYYPLINAVLHEAQQSGAPPATRMPFLNSSDAGLKRAASLAKSYFAFDPASGRMILADDAENPEVSSCCRPTCPDWPQAAATLPTKFSIPRLPALPVRLSPPLRILRPAGQGLPALRSILKR